MRSDLSVLEYLEEYLEPAPRIPRDVQEQALRTAKRIAHSRSER